MVMAYLAFLALVAVERLVELVLSRRHTAWALRRGGVERGWRHFPLMVAIHAGFLCSCAAEVVLLERSFVPPLGVPALVVTLLAQSLRYWAVASLGKHWNARVVVIPGTPLVRRGPYRHLRHPNYLAVILEGIALPLIHSAWVTALWFSLANALLLRTRIQVEEQALTLLASEPCAENGAARSRFIPGVV